MHDEQQQRSDPTEKSPSLSFSHASPALRYNGDAYGDGSVRGASSIPARDGHRAAHMKDHYFDSAISVPASSNPSSGIPTPRDFEESAFDARMHHPITAEDVVPALRCRNTVTDFGDSEEGKAAIAEEESRAKKNGTAIDVDDDDDDDDGDGGAAVASLRGGSEEDFLSFALRQKSLNPQPQASAAAGATAEDRRRVDAVILNPPFTTVISKWESVLDRMLEKGVDDDHDGDNNDSGSDDIHSTSTSTSASTPIAVRPAPPSALRPADTAPRRSPTRTTTAATAAAAAEEKGKEESCHERITLEQRRETNSKILAMFHEFDPASSLAHKQTPERARDAFIAPKAVFFLPDFLPSCGTDDDIPTFCWPPRPDEKEDRVGRVTVPVDSVPKTNDRDMDAKKAAE